MNCLIENCSRYQQHIAKSSSIRERSYKTVTITKAAFLLTIALSIFGTIAMFKPLPSHAAERISFSIPILGEFHLSVESLEIFAREGRITPEFAYFAKRLDDKSLENFRRILQTNFDVEPITMYRLTNLPMGEDSLRRMGEVVYTHPERNGMYAIRAGLILGAAEPDGLNAINFLRHFPGEEIQLNAMLIPSLAKETKSFLRYIDTTVKAIAKQAATEIKTQSAIDLKSLPDLDRAGQYQVDKQELTFAVDDLRQTHKGFLGNYKLKADIYLPISLRGTAPLAIITHGLGATRTDFAYLAEHLASHGYIVAVPVHSGSDRKYKDAYLNGEVGVDLSPIEFYSRPRDITHLLDRLEQHPNFQQQINWSQVGIVGHSLGGTTALTASGAPINLTRINHTCQQDRFNLNISVILQCRANSLPPGTYNLQDKRIKAVIALNPVTSSILGSESIKQVEIPTMILGGSSDYVAPFIEEQAHPFLWLTTADKYLVTVVNGSHFSTLTNGNIARFFDLSQSVTTSHSQNYIKALSLAFLEAHARDRPAYEAYLTAAYAKKISNPKLPLHLVRSLTPEQLASAYGDTPPIPALPEPLDVTKPGSNPQILAEIQQTGILKVAMRKDAAPFGYTDKNHNWVGYCADLTAAFGDRLTEELATSQPIKVVRISSTLANRFELIEQEKVHLECGPNSIVSDRQEVAFSDPFFSSGTRFLVNNSHASILDFNSSLNKVKLGVLDATTSQQFLEQQYPGAEIVVYEGQDGRDKGMQALNNADIDAFASDTVLLARELNNQGLEPKNYQTVPEQPLTCDYYGLILPIDDAQWRETVNIFIRDRSSKQVLNQWFASDYDRAITDLDYCQNRRE